MHTLHEIDSFLESARQGKNTDVMLFVNFAKKFDSIILWGAGNLGVAIGKKLLNLGVHIDIYWDIQAETKGRPNGIRVIKPFPKNVNKDKTLIIFCIGNVLTHRNILSQLYENQYQHIVNGVDLRSGLLCPMSLETKFDNRFCVENNFCAACGCTRLDSLIKDKFSTKDQGLFYSALHFLVNTVCNLKCKYCYQYMRSYPNSLKQNVSFERICRDIDVVMNAVDSIASVFIVGGETFMHPDIGRIFRKILEKENFGLLIIPTNGIVKMSKEQLDALQDFRVRLAFSNYIGSISAKQEEILWRNIELAQSMGINATFQNALPSWNIPGTFEEKPYSQEEVKNLRKHCAYICNWVYSGKIFICSFSISMHNLIKKYKDDFVDIDGATSQEDLRQKMIDLTNRPWLPSCMHCDNHIPNLTNRAGEQGFDERYAIERYIVESE
jgi:organic radical activating enzyme